MDSLENIDLRHFRAMIADYGVRDTVSLLIRALEEEANKLSDMGFKEKAIQAANMADVLREINGDSN